LGDFKKKYSGKEPILMSVLTKKKTKHHKKDYLWREGAYRESKPR